MERTRPPASTFNSDCWPAQLRSDPDHPGGCAAEGKKAMQQFEAAFGLHSGRGTGAGAGVSSEVAEDSMMVQPAPGFLTAADGSSLFLALSKGMPAPPEILSLEFS